MIKGRKLQTFSCTREVPNRKEVSNKTNMGKMIMTMPIKEAFAIYKRKFPTRKVGFTAFYKLKPSNIKKVSETNRRCCLCQLCCNVALLVEAANKFETENTESKGNLTKQSARDITVCKYDGEYPKAECMRRDCQKCSASAIKDYYEVISQEHGEKNIEYYKWEAVNIVSKDDRLRNVYHVYQSLRLLINS